MTVSTPISLAIQPYLNLRRSVLVPCSRTERLNLTVGLAISLHLLLPFRPIEQLMGLGLAATTASELAPDVGAIAQRYLSISPLKVLRSLVTVGDDRGILSRYAGKIGN
jgi:hypothetical protein